MRVLGSETINFPKAAWQITLAMLAAVSWTYGLAREENKAVLEKAIRICLECIGIG